MSESFENKQIEEQGTQSSVQFPFAVAIRFRNSGKPYSFGTYDSNISKGDYVVVETAQGIEMGQAEADALSVEKYSLHMPEKAILRVASDMDRDDYAENLVAEEEAFEICKEEIEDLGLQMNLLSAEYTLDRAKILFVYLAEQRVDFRELLKRLGSRLHCRIELRQIGERDKAKMVGGIGMCGMECCCRRFKNHFDVISINMAKNQLLALNIEKLSGMCGKLMCCLKYEDNDYKQLTEGLPKMGSQVEYEGKIYRLTGMNVMNSEAKLENREMALFISFDELREKGISRKGVVQPKTTEEEGKKPVRKQYIHTNQTNEVEQKKEDVQSHDNARTETRTFGSKHRENNNPNKNVEKRSFGSKNKDNNTNKNVEKRTFGSKKNTNNSSHNEQRNVTVRTFGKKKSEDKK